MSFATAVGFCTLCVIWGLSWVAIKYSLQEIPPFLGVGLRFAAAALFLLAFARLRSRPLSIAREDIRVVASVGFLIYSVNYGGVYWAEQMLTAGSTAVLFATFPLFVALLTQLSGGGANPARTFTGLLLARMSAVSLATFVYLTPVVAIVGAWLLLGETPHPQFLWGTFLVLVGVLVTQGPVSVIRRVTLRKGPV